MAESINFCWFTIWIADGVIGSVSLRVLDGTENDAKLLVSKIKTWSEELC